MKYPCLCASLLVAAFAGCKPAQPAKPHAAGAVKTDVPKKKPLHYLIVQPASVEAFEEAPLVARISANVAVVKKDIGDEWRVDDGKAVRAQLKVGVRVGPDVELLKMRVGESSWEPITGNEKIVVTNFGAVSEGKAIP